MVETPVYMDNHATTRVDPRVVDAMLPYFTTDYGNSGSTGHVFGWDARSAVDQSRETIAGAIGAKSREIVFTSGATESINLALCGVAERLRSKGKHLITVETEHKAVLDPLRRLTRRGFELTVLPVERAGSPSAGTVSPEQVADAIRDDTVLVSVMLANNEIGNIQPIAEIGAICRERRVAFHTDATQAVGKVPVDVEQLQIDLLSFSAHKQHGPKGVGTLYVRRGPPAVRLEPISVGGGQEGGLRGGTLNVPGIVGLAAATQLSCDDMQDESARIRAMRNRLYEGLCEAIPGIGLNGPALNDPALRLAGNLNVSFDQIDGEALMMSMRNLAVSSGSACTSESPEPSHVIRALGLSDELTRGSLRFGLARFNNDQEVEFAIETVAAAVDRLRKMRSMA